MSNNNSKTPFFRVLFIPAFFLGILTLISSSCNRNEKINSDSSPETDDPTSEEVLELPIARQEKLANDIMENTEQIFKCVHTASDSKSARVAVAVIKNSEGKLKTAYDELRVLESLPLEHSERIRRKFEDSFKRMNSLQKKANIAIKSLDSRSSKSITDAILDTSGVFRNNASVLKKHGFIE